MPTGFYPVAHGQILNGTLDGGRDGTPLVFINALGCDLRIWDRVVDRLTRHPGYGQRPLIRYDLRGHGLSDCPPPPYTIGDHTDDLADLMDALGTPAAVLIGLSVGGMIAMNYAVRYPEMVRALVLCDTAPRIGTAAMWNERIDVVRTHGMPYPVPAVLPRWFAPRYAREHPAAYRIYGNMLARMPVDGYTGTCEAIRDADLSDLAPRIMAPTLVLCGDEDVATPPEAGQALAEALPDARFERILHAAHLPCIEQPADFTERLVRFLDAL